jgi:hypothetical protein
VMLDLNIEVCCFPMVASVFHIGKSIVVLYNNWLTLSMGWHWRWGESTRKGR